MTDKNQKILAILKEDSRTAHSKIAVMLGITAAEVSAAVSEMEKSGVIVKYDIIINEEKTEVEKVQALIEVRVSPMHTKGFDCIAEDVYQFPEVKSCYLMSGAYDLAVFVEGRTLKDVAAFVSEKLSVMDKVLSTATHFILKKYKLDGVIIGTKNGNSRLVYQP